MDVVQKLIDQFRRFPGIGPRQAKRFAYFLMAAEGPFVKTLAAHIGALPKSVGQCVLCMRFFLKKERDAPKEAAHKETLCALCAKKRNAALLMLVARDIDCEAMEKSGSYDGYYFVLGDTLPLLAEAPEKKIRLHKLFEIVERRAAEGLREIILALDATAEGEHTAEFLEEKLTPRAVSRKITLSRLGRGFSTGTELEYSDAETIRDAMRNRA